MEKMEALYFMPGNQRFRTQLDWLDSWHSFSFGQHYDASNLGHGLLRVSNEDIVQPNSGFGKHPHKDMEIITWVISGELEHQDSAGNKGTIYPGLAQKMSAGSGIWHSEMNVSKETPVHLVQMWVVPDMQGIRPGYEQVDITRQLKQTRQMIPIASGSDSDTAIRIQQKDATLWVVRLQPGESIRLPEAPYVHVFVTQGQTALEPNGALNAGDALRMQHAQARKIGALGTQVAELLIWEMQSSFE